MIEIGQIFVVTKNKKQTNWKVIEDPYFAGQLCLVREYNGLHGIMRNGYSKEDNTHICGKTTLETAYDDAYLLS